MKSILLMMLLMTSSQLFAANTKCANQAVREAVLFNFNSYGANTSSCGLKALNIGDFYETYLACTTDETEPSEYVVVLNTNNCELSFIGASMQARTPNFDDDTNLLSTISCEIDGYDSVLKCQ